MLFTPIPTIDLGNDITVCADTFSIELIARYTSSGGVSWVSSGVVQGWQRTHANNGIYNAALDFVGIGTTSTDDTDLQGIGNSARGLYVSNGMILYDNAINGNHYIGTSMNGLMAGPVSVNGVLNVDGNFVVV